MLLKKIKVINLTFGKRKKSQGAKSEEYGGCRMTVVFYFTRKCWGKTEV
jgi:hypothetical protein